MSILTLTQTGGILRPFAVILGLIMNYIYRFLDMFGIESIGLTIILFTLIVNVLMIPLTIKQQKFTKMSALVNPEVQKIQKKYEGRRDERSMRMQQAETQAVYDKYGASPVGGCLPLLIQMPILLALYRVIYNVPAYVEPVRELYMKIAEPISTATGAGDIMTQFISDMSLRVTNFDITNMNKIIDALYNVPTTGWDKLTEAFAATPAVGDAIASVSSHIINMNTFLGVFNLSDAPIHLGVGPAGVIPGAIIPFLAAATQWGSMKIMQRNQPKLDENSQMGNTMNTMNNMMPLMSMFFCATLPTAMGLYWISQAVFRSLTTLFVDKFFLNASVDDIIEANKEKAAKKAEKRQVQSEKLETYAAMRTNNIKQPKTVSQLAKTSVEGHGENKKSAENNNSKKSSGKKGGKGSISGYANMLNKRD